MGYVISGTRTTDLLVVRDTDTAVGGDPDYFLDAPAAFDNANPPAPISGVGTGTMRRAAIVEQARTFTPGAKPARALKDPLWYAAKWGGFKDQRQQRRPEPACRMGRGRTMATPSNYYLVTDALTLPRAVRQGMPRRFSGA